MRPVNWRAVSPRRLCGVLVAGALSVGVSAAWAQDQSAATATDAIVARKSVMGALSEKMDDIEGAISAGKINMGAARAAADTISIFLMAFPHLFPPATNQWQPGDRDPVTDTSASPDVWTRFVDFYRDAAAASKSAFAASRAQTEDDLKAAIAQLRSQCNSCHAAYLKN